jgi:hypothetical protein
MEEFDAVEEKIKILEAYKTLKKGRISTVVGDTENKRRHTVSLAHNDSFWAQKLTYSVSFWAQKLLKWVTIISGPRN